MERLSLRVQQPLYPLDDGIAMSQEAFEEFDMGLERHLVMTGCGWSVFRRQKRLEGQASKRCADHSVPHIPVKTNPPVAPNGKKILLYPSGDGLMPVEKERCAVSSALEK